MGGVLGPAVPDAVRRRGSRRAPTLPGLWDAPARPRDRLQYELPDLPGATVTCPDCDDTGSYETTHVRQRSDGSVVHGNPGTPAAGGWALDTHPITRPCPCQGARMLVCPDCGLVQSRTRSVPRPTIAVAFDWECWDCGHRFGSIMEGGTLDLGWSARTTTVAATIPRSSSRSGPQS